MGDFFAAMGSKSSTADKTLFALLKDLRKEISDISIESLTPLEALNKLNELKKKIDDK